MCVGVRVFSVVVFLDLVAVIAIERECVSLLRSAFITFQHHCFYQLKPRCVAVMLVSGVVGVKFFLKLFPCFGRRELDIIMVMVTMIDSTVSCACHQCSGTHARVPASFHLLLNSLARFCHFGSFANAKLSSMFENFPV